MITPNTFSLNPCFTSLIGVACQVISTSGDTHLGGEDFDHRVMDYFIKLIKKKYKVDVSKDSRALQKLRREAERAKRALSSQHQARPCQGLDPLPYPAKRPEPSLLGASSARCSRITRRAPCQGPDPLTYLMTRL